MLLETIKAYDGKLYNLEYHQKRYEGQEDFTKLLNPPQKGLYRVRVLYTRDRVENIEYIPYTPRVITTLKLVESNISYEKKYADRTEIDALFAQRGECDDILIIKDGLVRDTSIANVAFFDGNRWVTPKQPLLEGTSRARYLDEGKIVEEDISLEQIYHYKKVALLNAMVDFAIIPQDNIRKICVR